MNIYRKLGTMIRCRKLSLINEIIDVENKIGVILTADLLKENYNFYLKFSVESVVEELMSENHSIRFKGLLALISEYKLIAQYRGLEFNQGFFNTSLFDYYKYYNIHQDLFKSEYRFGESAFTRLMYLCKMNTDLVTVYINLLKEGHFKNNRLITIPKSIKDLDQTVTRNNSNQSELDLLNAYIAVNLYSDDSQYVSSSSSSSSSGCGCNNSSSSSDSYSSSSSDSSY